MHNDWTIRAVSLFSYDSSPQMPGRAQVNPPSCIFHRLTRAGLDIVLIGITEEIEGYKQSARQFARSATVLGRYVRCVRIKTFKLSSSANMVFSHCLRNFTALRCALVDNPFPHVQGYNLIKGTNVLQTSKCGAVGKIMNTPNKFIDPTKKNNFKKRS